MLTPASPAQLAALAVRLGAGYAASPDLVLEVARRVTEDRTMSDEEFGRYCRTQLPPVLKRLLAAESATAALRTVLARHVAAADLGEDPQPRDLLDACQRIGVNLRSDVADAREVLDAETRYAAYH
ncbi:hypothetical protein [Streptomyces anulatus]|uniref:hypothetical protein n=1 Tax=Streptomyces anulatus TaxID=1892 RepID=UPI0037DD8347|nr:hypothetical protein OHB50_39515 [Streptomyces anulatus]